ncbi:hypothetical protein CVT24_012821, partial [Panaeolus cyanescens]
QSPPPPPPPPAQSPVPPLLPQRQSPPPPQLPAPRPKRPKRSQAGDAAGSGPSKRAKVKDGGATADAGKAWFEDALRLFIEGAHGFGDEGKGSLGGKWIECVEAYTAFQQRSGFSDDRRLPTKGRPGVVSEWIGVGRTRSMTWRPRALVPEHFEKVFEVWWTGLQPDWRVEGGKVVKSKILGDWSKLAYPGPNGLLSVMGALYYWGLEAYGKKARWKKWESAVIDCTTAFNHC